MTFDVERARRLAVSSQDNGKLSRAIDDACDEIGRLRSALYEVERYFGDELPPAGFPMGVVRAASNQDTRSE